MKGIVPIAIAFLCGTAAAALLVTYQSPCECLDDLGKQRWAEKNDRQDQRQHKSYSYAKVSSDSTGLPDTALKEIAIGDR